MRTLMSSPQLALAAWLFPSTSTRAPQVGSAHHTRRPGLRLRHRWLFLDARRRHCLPFFALREAWLLGVGGAPLVRECSANKPRVCSREPPPPAFVSRAARGGKTNPVPSRKCPECAQLPWLWMVLCTRRGCPPKSMYGRLNLPAPTLACVEGVLGCARRVFECSQLSGQPAAPRAQHTFIGCWSGHSAV
jgi:hypothetical protein